MPRSRRAALFAVVFSVGLLGSSAAFAAETLADAIASAYDSNPDILVQRSRLRSTDEQYYRTQRSLSPTISADAVITADRSRDTSACLVQTPAGCTSYGRVDDSGQAGSLALNLSQPIYTGGLLSANVKTQEALLLAQREVLRQAEASLVQAVIQAYLGVHLGEQSLDIAKENVTVLQRQRDEAQARFEVGASTRTDVAQADSRLATARSNLTAAQTSLDNARAQYQTVVGHAPIDLAPEPSLADMLPKTVGAAFDTAREDNPTLRQAYLTERASAAQISAARSIRRPQISVGVSAGYLPNNFGQRENTEVVGSARVSVPLFTGLTTGSTIRSAVETNRADNFTIDGQIRSLQRLVTQSWNNLVSARATIVSSEEAVRAARLAAEGTREEQQVGLRTILDLLNAEQELRNAEQTLVNARYNEYVAAVALLNAMGQLEAKRFSPQIDAYDPAAYYNRVTRFGLPWEPVVRTLDRIGAAPIPQRQPGPGEVTPDLGRLH